MFNGNRMNGYGAEKPLSREQEAVPPHLRSPAAFIGHYLGAWRWHFGCLAVFIVSAATCAVGVQYELKLLIDAMTSDTGHQVGNPSSGIGRQVWSALGAFMALIALENLLWRLSGWLGCKATIGVGVAMRLDLFHHLSGQAIRYFTENLAGSLGQRITAVAGNFGALCNTFIWRIAPPCVDFVGAAVIFATIDGRMAIALCLFVSIVMTGLVWFGRYGQPLHRAYAARAGGAVGALTDVIINMWSVKAFSARRREHDRLAAEFSEEARAQKDSWLHMEKTRLLHDIALWTMAGAMLCWTIYRWGNGAVTVGDVVMVSTLTFRILHGARDLALALVDVAQQIGHIEDTLGVIGRRPAVVDGQQPRLRTEGGSVEFRDVSFAYDDPAHAAIKDVSLHIPAGQKVAIVGPSGAGKSTLAALIQRLYDAQEGEILLNGQPANSISQDALRDALAVVPQEICLFHRSVMENIRFARPDAPDSAVVEAACSAHCHDFIQRLPYGYETLIGERGARLSGGQRQRLAIARAFLKHAPILILDEATSSLDTELELRIQRSLLERLADRTVIAVAHRLSSVAAFDRVVVMVGGRVVEDGSPRELRRRGGTFAKMWHLQAEGVPLH